jgi:hypothetical protein
MQRSENVTQVLSNVGIGFGNTDQTDKEVEAMSTDAKYKISDEKGTQPTNFDMGEVVEKK